jgi:hypothetical protein
MFFRPTYPNFFAFEAGKRTIFFFGLMPIMAIKELIAYFLTSQSRIFYSYGDGEGLHATSLPLLGVYTS